MQYIRDLSLVLVASANLVELPAGATSLIESNQGPLVFTVPREGFTDAVVLFPLLDGTTPNTTWFRFISFPLFLLNSMQALGNVREGSGEEVRSPGRPVILRAETLGKDLLVSSASGQATGNPVSVHHSEIRCQFTILAQKDEPTPDYATDYSKR